MDRSTEIDDIAKFCYLLSYLSGEPADMSPSLHIDGGNNNTSKDLLMKRYGDKPQTITVIS